ncbi:MAG: hypothetical protein K2P17_03965 [Helicobacteraceae bacterium]|nr:hypothetical protein [Helicobacteraceae bacterium]
MADLSFSDVFNGAVGAWSDYNATKQEALKADAAQQNYQASLNQATLAQTLAKNKTTLALIIGGVVILVAFFMFRK